jgi:nucleotide sugar dehydrogenase
MGHNVKFFDISKHRLAALREEGYDVASSLKDAISQSEISFVCVNTPQSKYSKNENHKYSNDNNSVNYEIDPIDEDLGKHQDLSQLLSALRDIGNALNDNITNGRHLLVFRSTMIPGTMRNVVLDYLEANCDLKHGKDYDVLYNPEFLRQHSAMEDFFTPDRIVIGQESPGSSSPLSDLYSPLTKNIILTGYEEAEMAKYASNCFLALKIGINEDEVSLAVSMDTRIGSYGTRGGRPYGGACFPKDTEAFASFARKMNVKPDLIETTISINEQMEDLNAAAKVYAKEKIAKDRFITESEV